MKEYVTIVRRLSGHPVVPYLLSDCKSRMFLWKTVMDMILVAHGQAEMLPGGICHIC
jgi:hypothetical protein